MDQMDEQPRPVTIEPPAVVESREKPTDKPPPEVKPLRYHRVKAGETLYRISRTYGLTVDELRRLNKLGPTAVIYVGQELIVETPNPDL